MTFEPVAHEKFPALRLGIEAGRKGGAAPAVFNAANEQAVSLFLDGKIEFPDIVLSISSALDRLADLPSATREELLEADAQARNHVMELFEC
jgi:1-deoxy-D-xylulose-5-phosphate reductoisomerase